MNIYNFFFLLVVKYVYTYIIKIKVKKQKKKKKKIIYYKINIKNINNLKIFNFNLTKILLIIYY